MMDYPFPYSLLAKITVFALAQGRSELFVLTNRTKPIVAGKQTNRLLTIRML